VQYTLLVVFFGRRNANVALRGSAAAGVDSSDLQTSSFACRLARVWRSFSISFKLVSSCTGLVGLVNRSKGVVRTLTVATLSRPSHCLKRTGSKGAKWLTKVVLARGIYTVIKTTSVGDARLSVVVVVGTRYGVSQPRADAERYRCACLHMHMCR